MLVVIKKTRFVREPSRPREGRSPPPSISLSLLLPVRADIRRYQREGSIMSSLPSHPNLEHLRNQAKALVKAHRAGDTLACERLQRHLPRLGSVASEEILTERVTLQEAQHVVACEYGYRNWAALVEALKAGPGARTSAESTPQVYRLRVTAGEPDTEVAFAGTVAVQNGTPDFLAIDQSTPFEVETLAEILSGTFTTTDHGKTLQLELSSPLQGKMQKILSGNGRRITFVERIHAQQTWRSIWVF